jgi:hypothetical protein
VRSRARVDGRFVLADHYSGHRQEFEVGWLERRLRVRGR